MNRDGAGGTKEGLLGTPGLVNTPRFKGLGRESITGIQGEQHGRGLPSGAKALAGGRSQLVANQQKSWEIYTQAGFSPSL